MRIDRACRKIYLFNLQFLGTSEYPTGFYFSGISSFSVNLRQQLEVMLGTLKTATQFDCVFHLQTHGGPVDQGDLILRTGAAKDTNNTQTKHN